MFIKNNDKIPSPLIDEILSPNHYVRKGLRNFSKAPTQGDLRVFEGRGPDFIEKIQVYNSAESELNIESTVDI